MHNKFKLELRCHLKILFVVQSCVIKFRIHSNDSKLLKKLKYLCLIICNTEQTSITRCTKRQFSLRSSVEKDIDYDWHGLGHFSDLLVRLHYLLNSTLQINNITIGQPIQKQHLLHIVTAVKQRFSTHSGEPRIVFSLFRWHCGNPFTSALIKD